MPSPLWKLEAHTATLDVNAWHARINGVALEHGLVGFRLGNELISGLLLFGLTTAVPASPIADIYVRGSDLIVALGATDRWPVRLELCWRARIEPWADSLCIDFQVSAQTPLLDSPATLIVSSEVSGTVIDCGQSRPADAHPPVSDGQAFTLCRLSSPAKSLVYAVHPSDFCGHEVERAPDSARIRCPLFCERLEKGVIRRARLRAVFIPRERDIEHAGRLFRQFAEEDPDLSA